MRWENVFDDLSKAIFSKILSSGFRVNLILLNEFASFGVSNVFNNQMASKALSARLLSSIVLSTLSFGDVNSSTNLTNSAGSWLAKSNSIQEAVQVLVFSCIVFDLLFKVKSR